MDDGSHKKKPWFGPKRTGYGITPISWQGWLVVVLAVGIELATITITHARRPAWFRAKTNGSGFTPATWEGWLVTLGPIVLLLLITLFVYSKQRKD